MGDINTRISELIADLKLSKNQFANKIGSSSAMVSKITNQKTNFGKDMLEKIISAYPDLNAHWLLTGVGEMWNIVFGLSSKPDTANLHRQQNITKALAPVPADATKTTPRQIFIAQDNFDKLSTSLRNVQGELAGLLIYIEEFENLRDFTDEFSLLYTDSIFTALFDTHKYLDGNKFNYVAYENDVINELEKFKGFSKPLGKLISAYQQFLKEIKPLDRENILDNYIKSHK